MTAIARPNGGEPSRNVTSMPPRGKVVTPSNTDVWQTPVHLFVLDAGDISVLDAEGNSSPWTISAGMLTNGPWLVPHQVTKLNATGTTSTSFRVVY